MRIVPSQAPQVTRDETIELLAEAGLEVLDRAVLLGLRGYFANFGVPGNDVGIYDDGIVLISPTAFVAYNANTDPSATRSKVAVLQPGRWLYKVGTHNINKPPEKRYRALVQAGSVDVFRPQTESTPKGTNSTLGACQGDGVWRGWFGINIHRGGVNTTSSEGCQTIYRLQWDAFLAQTEAEMKRHGQKTIEYCLTQRPTA